MKVILCISLLFSSSSLFGQFYNTDDIKETIHLRMLRFYGYSGNWKVTIKEWSEDRDTILFKGMAEGRIKTKSDVAKDSSELTFDFSWDTKFDSEMIDMSEITIGYNWEDEKYRVFLHHLPKNETWIVSFYAMKADEVVKADEVIASMTFYSELFQKTQQPIPFSKWFFEDNRVIMTLYQRRIDESIRMRIFDFERLNDL
jgi:hypothetical protein